MLDLKRAVLASASVLALVASAQETGTGSCTDVHVFLSRGNNEPYPGRQGKLVQAICSGVDSCDYEDIAFDNALEVEYCSAVEAGRKAGVDQITAYNKKCPDTQLVVSGYSQGAQVVGDILGGGGGTFFQGCTTPSTAGLDPKSAPGNKIVAALLFGDTRHTADQPFNSLAGAKYNGLFPRTGEQLTGLNAFDDVLRDWCQGDDPICAAGDGSRNTVTEHHLNYFDVYSGSAGDWVKSKLGKTSSPSSSSSSSSAEETSTTAATSSATSATPTSTGDATTSSASVPITVSASLPITTLTTSMTTPPSPSSEGPAPTDVTPVPLPSPVPTQVPEAGAAALTSSMLPLGLGALVSFLFLAA
ncbi:carbohydrate esterase family 5 protein [Hypoxylon sp. FL1284]|nr:carbohydrate esterase family 5 protein [Hypoxylon sp. FL1284]